MAPRMTVISARLPPLPPAMLRPSDRNERSRCKPEFTRRNRPSLPSPPRSRRRLSGSVAAPKGRVAYTCFARNIACVSLRAAVGELARLSCVHASVLLGAKRCAQSCRLAKHAPKPSAPIIRAPRTRETSLSQAHNRREDDLDESGLFGFLPLSCTSETNDHAELSDIESFVCVYSLKFAGRQFLF